MLLSCRFFARSMVWLLCVASGACAAQVSEPSNQFQNVSHVQPTGGRLAGFVTGTFQAPPQGTDFLYVNAAAGSNNPVTSNGVGLTVTAGELLKRSGAGFANLIENQLVFSDVSIAVATTSNFAGFGTVGYAFALTPAGSVTTNLCIYAGIGAQPPTVGLPRQGSSYDLGLTPNTGNYPPAGGKSGCTTFPTLPTSASAVFGYIAAMPFRTGLAPQLLVEDTTNGIVYVMTNDGTGGSNGLLPGVAVANSIQLPGSDGAGPLYTADLNGDGNTDLVVNNQAGLAATIYLGNGDGTFQPPMRVTFGEHIHSMLLEDMDGDGIPDMVAELDGGVIEIHKGNGDGTFQAGSIGGTVRDAENALAGNGGHLVGIADLNHDGLADIVTTTPIGMSVLLNQGQNQFKLTNIYNIGPGRSAYALGDFYGTGNVDLAVDSDEGVAIVDGYGDGTFRPSAVVKHQTQSVTTVTTLYLCVGPTLACPSNGTVVPPPPPYPTDLGSIYFGQTFNGVTDATASDGSALSPLSVIDFEDSVNGAAPVPLCTLAIGPPATACPPSVGTTVGTGVGMNVYTTVYAGDATHLQSSSPTVTINILPDLTTATLVGAPNPSQQGQPVTFTVTVTGNFAAPAGPVVFSYGGMVLGSGNLVAGSGLSSTAMLTTAALPQGMDMVTASYAGTTDFNAVSATFTETVTASLAGNFAITVTPTPVTVGVGYSTLLVVTVTPLNGFAQGVNLTCANLPAEASCFFDSPSIGAGGWTTELVVGTTAPHTCGTTTPYFLGSNSSGGGGPWPMGLGALAGVAMLFIPGKRRWLRSLIAIAVVAAATQMTGCGTCTDLGTRPATYTFQVVGTATGSSTTQAQSVTLTVTI